MVHETAADEEVILDVWMFEIVGGVAALTVMVVCAVTIPFRLEAVRV